MCSCQHMNYVVSVDFKKCRNICLWLTVFRGFIEGNKIADWGLLTVDLKEH